MKNIVFILTMAACFTIYGQKCNFDYEKKDAFTGKTVVAIQCNLNKSWRMSLSNDGAVCNVGIGLLFPGVRNEIIHKGDTLMLALENAKPLIFTANGDFKPVSNAVGTSVYTTYQPMYSATKEQFQELSEKKTTAYKVYLGSQAYSDEIKPKNSEKISKAAGCVVTGK